MIYDLLIMIYCMVIFTYFFHLVSIVRKKEMWIYVLEKNISIRVELHTIV